MKKRINSLLAMAVCGAFVLPNSGQWYAKDDSPDKGASTISFKVDEKVNAAGGDGSVYFEYSLGKGFQWPYVQLLCPLSRDGEGTADLGGYSGVSLWAKTEGKTQVRLVIFTSEDGVTDMNNSGTYRHNEVSIKTSDKFVLYKIPFEQFKTPQWWLSQHPKAKKQIDWSKSIEFAVMEDDSLSAGASEKGWIDDVTFYRGPLEIKGAIPADRESGVKAGSPVKISFNFPVAAEELQKNFKLIKVDQGGKPVECNITVSADGREAMFTPAKPLDAKSRYLYKIYKRVVNFTTEYGIGNIYGRVTGEDGKPVEGASIRTYPDDKRTRSDKDGRYYFEGVNLDRICLYCIKDGYYTGFGILPLVPKEDFYVDFRLSEVPKMNGKVQPYIFGVNFNDWETEGYLLPVKDKVKAAGFTIMRWGGIGKDLIEVDEAKIDEFISYAKAVRTEPVVQVRLIKGSIEEAVKAVRYCNTAKRYKVKYWIIGNEPDWYNQKEWGPYGAEDYCRDYRAYYNAMKAVDPSIRIMGPELTAKYYLAAQDNWIEPFLRECGDIVDIISIHLYPYSGKQPPQQTLMGLGNYRRVIDSIREKTKEIAGREIPIAVTEYNLTWDWLAEGDGANNSFYAGLYLADFLGAMAEKQVFMTNFWDIMERGTIGFLEHETFKPYPTYYTFVMYKNFRGELIDVNPGRKELKVYGAKDKSGNVILMVINKSGSRQVEAELAPAALKKAQDRYYSFPPYSLTCLKISSGGKCSDAWQYSKEMYDK
ncbi:MAG: Ig-like domain-containing protein, partial [Candidatus Omnitrophota bacterium]